MEFLLPSSPFGVAAGFLGASVWTLLSRYFQVYALGYCWGKIILMINRKDALAGKKK